MNRVRTKANAACISMLLTYLGLIHLEEYIPKTIFVLVISILVGVVVFQDIINPEDFNDW